MTTKEAAERLGVSHRHMLDLMAEGSIPRVLVGRRAVRIDPQDLEEFIASRKGA